MEKSIEPYPGYPTTRLHLDISDTASLEGIELPHGPWEHTTAPLPTPEESAAFKAKGYQLDSLGRPLHPWALELLKTEGVVVGKGFYWKWGPNPTADPIVITNEPRPRILLIERGDTGAYALPGGFIDGDEPAEAAARRELKEETGLELTQSGICVYEGPVADRRTTLHAWAETAAYLFTVDAPAPVEGADDARSAGWYPIDELPGILYGSHALLVQRAFATLEPDHTK